LSPWATSASKSSGMSFISLPLYPRGGWKFGSGNGRNASLPRGLLRSKLANFAQTSMKLSKGNRSSPDDRDIKSEAASSGR